jgi:aminoglycoside 6'-N-acetyltransferase I
MNVRPGVASDRDDLFGMRTALWSDATEDEVDDVLGVPPDEGTVLVAEGEGGRLLGFAEVGLRKFADGCRSSPVAYLEGIWTEPSSRRVGIASALVRQAEAWAQARGLTELASDCEVGNEASRAFHIAGGFEEVQRSICFRRDLGARSR